MPTTGMTITRRRAVAGLGAALTFPAILKAGAQTAWPSKPVKMIMPYAPGGAGDTVARPWAEAPAGWGKHFCTACLRASCCTAGFRGMACVCVCLS